MKSNCLFFVLQKYWKEGGYIIAVKSKWGPWFHFYWSKNLVIFEEFIPLTKKYKHILPPLWFSGRVKQTIPAKKAMKKLLIILLLLIPSTGIGQTLKFTDTELQFNSMEGETSNELTNYTFRLYVNNDAPIVTPFVCSGEIKPWKCIATTPPLRLGTNTLYLTLQPPPAADGVLRPELPKSNEVIIYFAVLQRETVNTSYNQQVARCQANTYAVQRITDATKLNNILNTVPAPQMVFNITGTSNAIYIFTCIPLPL